MESWSHVLSVLKEKDGIPWEILSRTKGIQDSDDDHIKVCRILLTRLNASDGFKEDVLDVLVKPCPKVFIFLTNAWLPDDKPSFRRDLLQRAVERYLTGGMLGTVVVKSDQDLLDQVITKVICLPDVVGNSYKKKVPHMFIEEIYFKSLISSLIPCLKPENMEPMAALVTRIAIRVKCNSNSYLLYQLLFSDESKREVNSLLLQSVGDEGLEPLLKGILENSRNIEHVCQLISDSLFQRNRVLYLVLNKFILVSFYSVAQDGSSLLPRNLMALLQERNRLFEGVKVALTAFSSRRSSRTFHQNMYIYSLLAVSSQYLETLSLEEKSQLHRIALKGIEDHLKNTSSDSRNCSLFLGQILVNLLKPHDSPSLDFETDEDETVSLLKMYMNPCPSFEERKLEPKLEEEKQINAPLIQEIGSSDTLEQEPNETLEQESNETTENEDQYDPLEQVKKPIYLTDCLEGLQEPEKHEWFLCCLDSAEDLIKKNAFAAQEIDLDMTRTLLYLDNEVESFLPSRINALIAMAVVSPSTVSKYLISQFYSRKISMAMRLDILQVLSKASQKISGRQETPGNPTSNALENESLLDLVIPSQVKELNWRHVVEERIENKTKRFGSRVQPTPEAKPNAFAKYTRDFFFPLIHGFEDMFMVPEFDSMILSRLIYCLGIMVDCASNTLSSRMMAKSLLPFISRERKNPDQSVQQAVCFSLSVLMSSVSPVVLLEELREEMLELKDWLVWLTESGSECRSSAIQVLMMLNKLVTDMT